MKKTLSVFSVIILLVALAVCCGCQQDVAFNPALCVVGDVEQSVTLTEAENDFEKVDFSEDNQKYSGYSLKEIIDTAVPKNADSTIYLLASDGMMAAFAYADLAESYIFFADKGWETVNIGYPPSGNVKEIKSVIVVDNAENPQYGLKIGKADGSVEVLTCGRLMVSDRQIITKTEGTNEKGGHAVTVYTSKEGLYIPDYLQVSADGYVMLTEAGGGKAYYYADGYIFAKENRIDYYSAIDKEIVENIAEVSAANQ